MPAGQLVLCAVHPVADVRTFASTEGVVCADEYVPAGQSAWVYSATYNLLYLVPSAVVTAIVLWPLLRAYDAAFPDPRRIVS